MLPSTGEVDANHEASADMRALLHNFNETCKICLCTYIFIELRHFISFTTCCLNSNYLCFSLVYLGDFFTEGFLNECIRDRKSVV